MASLRNVGGSRWQVAVYVGRDSLGKQRRVTRVFDAPNLQAARRRAAAVEAELRTAMPDREAVGRTVGWLVDEWVQHRESQPTTSPTTIAHQRSVVNRIKKDLGQVRLDKLSPLMIEKFYAGLRQNRVGKDGKGGHGSRPISESTVHHYHRVLKSIIRQGHRWGYIDKVVIERTTPPAPRKRTITVPSADEVGRLLAAAPADLAVLLRVYASTGARRSEVLGLTWGDYDGNTVTFRRTVMQVNGKPLMIKEWLKNPDEPPRVVLLDRMTVAMLDEYRERLTVGLHDVDSRMGDGVYLFPDLKADPTGRTPRRPNTITQLFRDLCDQQGLTMRLHDLRHWHASQLIASGAPITDVAARLGHSQTSTTLNIYAHATRANDGLLASIIGTALQNAESPQHGAGGDGQVG